MALAVLRVLVFFCLLGDKDNELVSSSRSPLPSGEALSAKMLNMVPDPFFCFRVGPLAKAAPISFSPLAELGDDWVVRWGKPDF